MSQILWTTLVFAFLLSGATGAQAQESYELMCRNKAKEIAAETYKNCVTENRQNKISQIRDEYKQKLSELKNHYDNELKNVGSASQASSTSSKPAVKQTRKTTTAASKKLNSRASGARTLPEKTVATEVIDLSSPSVTAEPVDLAQPAASSDSYENRMTSDQQGLSDGEVVELPVQ